MSYARRILLASALVACVGAGGPALAADLAEQPYVEPVPVATGGWYLRGDIGYKFYNSPDISFVTPTYTDSWNNTSLDDTWMLGAGVGLIGLSAIIPLGGMIKNPWKRGELTVAGDGTLHTTG